MPKKTAIALPHGIATALPPPAIGGSPPPADVQRGVRVGGLVWWKFRNSDGEFTDLAEAAEKAGLSPLFSPLPHPVSPAVAFSRTTLAAERVLGEERWRGDLVGETGPLSGEIPDKVREWARRFRPRALVAAIETWEPEREPVERPWHVRLWIAFRQDPKTPLAHQTPLPERARAEREILDSRWLPTQNAVCFFIVIETPERQEVLDITDHVLRVATVPTARFDVTMETERDALVAEVLKVLGVTPTPGELPEEAQRGGSSLYMARHLFQVLDRERTRCTSSEIGDGVNLGLEDAGGVKLHPGLFIVPGEKGVKRAEEILGYLGEVPNCDCGMFDLYEETSAPRLGGLIEPFLEAEVELLEAEVRGLGTEAGVGALRTLGRRITDQLRRIGLNASLLGSAGVRLVARLEMLRGVLKQRLGHRDLDPEPPRTARNQLDLGFEQIRTFAASGEIEALGEAGEALGGATGAMRTLRCKNFLRRLRKQVAAAIHVFYDRSHGSAADARDRIERLRPVLARAAEDLERGCV